MSIVTWITVGVLAVSLLAVGYAYVGYPILLMVWSRYFTKSWLRSGNTPATSVLIAVYNGEEVIGRRIENCLALDYPKEQMEIIIGADGCDDETEAVVRRYATDGVRLLSLSRRGKAMTDNALVVAASHDIIVTTSAASLYEPDFLKKIVRNFTDSDVGCVTGYIRPSNAKLTTTAASEEEYWRYEMRLQDMESKLGILCVSAGPALAFRRDNFAELRTFGDADNSVPLNTLRNGYRVVHEPEAIVYDEMVVDTAQQFKDKLRHVSKSQRDVLSQVRYLDLLRHRGPLFSLVSHRLLRWWSPFFLIVAMSMNLFLLEFSVFQVTLAIQVAFYLFAALTFLTGHLIQWHGRLLMMPLTFCVAQAAFFVGTVGIFARQSNGLWTPSTQSNVDIPHEASSCHDNERSSQP